MWFFIAIWAPILFAATNYFDKILISKYYHATTNGSLLIFSSLIGFLFAPIFFLLSTGAVNISQWPYVVLGFIYIAAIYPYILAMQEDETSNVVPLFQAVPIMGVLAGHVFLGEDLRLLQIIGILLCVVGAVFLTIDLKTFRLKTSVLLYMLMSSSLFVAYTTIFKALVKDGTNFYAISFWEYIGFCIIGILFLFVPRWRDDFLGSFKANSKKILSLNLINEVVNIFGKQAYNYPLLLAPASLVLSINAFQPMFILIFGVLLTKFFPKIVSENIEKRLLLQKIVAIVVLILASILVQI